MVYSLRTWDPDRTRPGTLYHPLQILNDVKGLIRVEHSNG